MTSLESSKFRVLKFSWHGLCLEKLMRRFVLTAIKGGAVAVHGAAPIFFERQNFV